MEPAKPQLRLIKLPEVKNRTGESTAKIYDGMADGTFPLSVATGPNSRAWVEHEIDEWIQARIAARDSGADADLRVINPNIGKGRQDCRQPTPIADYTEQRASDGVEPAPARRRRQPQREGVT